MGAIHSTKLSGNFGLKLNGSVRSNRKSFEKTGPPFEVVVFSRSDRLEVWLNGSRPIKNGPGYGRRALRDETEPLCAKEWIKSLFYLECQMISESLNLHFSCQNNVLKTQFNCSWFCLLSFLGGLVTKFPQVPEKYFGHLACQMGCTVHSMRQVPH